MSYMEENCLICSQCGLEQLYKIIVKNIESLHYFNYLKTRTNNKPRILFSFLLSASLYFSLVQMCRDLAQNHHPNPQKTLTRVKKCLFFS